MTALFSHQKLDWTIRKLEERLEASIEDHALRLELARALYSRAVYHCGTSPADSGENLCSQVLAMSRKVLQDDPANAEALVLAGLSLVHMQRPDAAAKYLEQGLRVDAERADLHLGLGLLEQMRRDWGRAIRELESACRQAPEAWETHLALGRVLLRIGEKTAGKLRIVERAQFHFVSCLRLNPPPDQHPILLESIGVTCMMTGRHKEAEKFFIRLREHEKHAQTARYQLGLVAYELGKYNNAVQHFRQYLRTRPDDEEVLSRIALAWFQLGEFRRTREACNQALLVNPDNLEARHALGCTQLEEGDPNEAIRTFRELLKSHPDHMPTYLELARTRRMGGDAEWLVKALMAEVGQFDRLPLSNNIDARGLTRKRIRIILEELRNVGASTTTSILRAINHTQDEGLRFQLWEAACEMSMSAVADATCVQLREPGQNYSAQLGGIALATAQAVPEPVLTSGLNIDETDLKRAAVDRNNPADNVQAHRQNLDHQRDQARAYQALLLLSIGIRRSAAGKVLLMQWADVADPELATAAWTALAMYGEPLATKNLYNRAMEQNAGTFVARLLAQVTPRTARIRPRRVSDAEKLTCTICGRAQSDVSHLMAGNKAVICDHCVGKVYHHRGTLQAPDQATCSLCNRSHFESSGLYRVNRVDVCSDCVQLSMGLVEREEINQFLATW